MSRISDVLKLIEFPAEATEYFEEVFAKTEGDENLMFRLDKMEKMYFETFNSDELEEKLDEFSEASGYHRYTVDMLLAVYCCIKLRKMYAEKGFDDSFFAHTMKDLTYKLNECKKLHDIWGTFVFKWFEGFYKMKRFTLGRLQYEPYVTNYSYKDIIKEGDTVINMHIPSSGPLTPCSVQESLQLAYDFFGPNNGDKLVIVCHSWLLYPPVAELFPEGSNMRRFYEVFDIFNQVEEPNDYDLWRVFYVNTKDYASLPQNTSLQKSFYTYLNDGNHFGNGYGAIVYKPE